MPYSSTIKILARSVFMFDNYWVMLGGLFWKSHLDRVELVKKRVNISRPCELSHSGRRALVIDWLLDRGQVLVFKNTYSIMSDLLFNLLWHGELRNKIDVTFHCWLEEHFLPVASSWFNSLTCRGCHAVRSHDCVQYLYMELIQQMIGMNSHAEQYFVESRFVVHNKLMMV